MGGISTNTGNYILYGTNAYVTVNGVDLGATIGDIAVNMQTEEYYPDLFQARGPVSGTGKIIGASGSVTVTMAEHNWTVLSALWSAGSGSDASSQMIGSGTLANITELNNVIVTGASRNDGKLFVVTIPKARATSPVAITLSESQESGIEVTFEALFTLNAPDKMPMWIKYQV